MFIVVTTLEFSRTHGGPSYKDNYELADTLEEARAIIEKRKRQDYVPGEYSLYSWAIAEVLDAADPHWIEKKENWGPDK
jgi:hypothetical protein